jgi:hypothetical protein
VETSFEPRIESERRSWVGKRVLGDDERSRPDGATDGPGHGVIDVVRRDPSRSVLNRVLREHLETFLARFTDEHGGRTLPGYVERELRAVIACGDLAHGFCRVRCPCCALDLLVAFSCKRRGFCPSCGGRRMAELAAHLVDGVIPDVPTRQWVLSMPIALRLHLAADPDLLREVASVFVDAVFASYARGARAAGSIDAAGSLVYPGAVNFVQRFGSSLGLNVHFHLLSLDGVYITEGPGRTSTFHAAPTLTDIEVSRVHHDTRQRIERVLRARGLLREPGDDPAPVKGADESLLPFLQAASAQSKVAGGPDTGRSIPRLIDPTAVGFERSSLDLQRGALKAESDGYSLHAATCLPAGKRDALEHVVRYMARPPLAQGRLMLRDDGKVIWNLRKPWRDGTRAFVFDPLVFLERLIALIPPPRSHQITYHGCFAPASPVRDHVVPLPPSRRERPLCASGVAPNQPVARRRFSWSDLLKRVFLEEVLNCPRCQQRRHMIAMITDPLTIRKFLLHLKLPPDPLPIAPAREPAQPALYW